MNINPHLQEAQRTSSKRNAKVPQLGFHSKTSENQRQKIFKVATGKKKRHITFRRATIKMTEDFSTETLEARNNDISQATMEK